jgi:hypothetical protein
LFVTEGAEWNKRFALVRKKKRMVKLELLFVAVAAGCSVQFALDEKELEVLCFFAKCSACLCGMQNAISLKRKKDALLLFVIEAAKCGLPWRKKRKG